MARRSTATKTEQPAKTETVTLTLSAQPSGTGVRRASRNVETDPAFTQVEADLLSTLTQGALQYEVSTEDQAKKVVSLLQRACSKNDTADSPLGMRKSISDSGRGTYFVDFEAKRAKRERTYTAADIRAFAVANGLGEIKGRIPQEVRNAFRESRGLSVKAVETVEEN